MTSRNKRNFTTVEYSNWFEKNEGEFLSIVYTKNCALNSN